MLQVIKEGMLDYDSFLTVLLPEVIKLMGDDYSVQIYKVIKNNSMEQDSLVLLRKGSKVAPNIYLTPYYEAYLYGTSVPEIANRICRSYSEHTLPVLDEEFAYSMEAMKPFIVYRLVSYERNRKLLRNIPHKKYLDLAITYHCLVRDDGPGIGTIRITNEHMKMWETTLEKIDELARNNTKELFPPLIQTMDEVIQNLLYDENKDSMITNLIPDPWNSDENDQLLLNRYPMYILTNQKGINGATSLLYDGVISKFADKISSDLYILPSSIHEVILVPKLSEESRKTLMEMVRDVNRTQVAPEEILSDRVYYYSRKQRSILL